MRGDVLVLKKTFLREIEVFSILRGSMLGDLPKWVVKQGDSTLKN